MAPAPATPTIKANAQLVVVDVVVTDKAQHPVHGLKASDFTLTESGAPQTIKNFEEHTALTVADATKLAPMPKLPPGVYTNYSPAPANGAVNLVLLDALNTPMKDQSYARQQFLAYLKTVPPGTRIAIFGLTNHLVALQSFTSDPEVLQRVMSKGLPKSSVLLDDAVGGGGVQNSTADDLEDAGADAETVTGLRDFEAQIQSFQLQLRAKYTLDAFNDIAHYLAGIPGRKNLIWFSGSFPIDVLPDTTGTQSNPFAAMASAEDEFRDTVSLLARSQVAVYPIDARGLFTSPVFDASTSRNYGGAKGIARMNQDQQKFFTDTAQEHGTMQDMADATGGRAFVNNNDLTHAVATAIEEGSNFYTLTYTPTNYKADGKLRKIKVDVDRPKLTLAYRHGYYADDPDALHTPKTGISDAAVTSASASSSQDAMRLAMTRGAPTPTQILLRADVFPAAPASQTEDTVAPGNAPSAKAKGPFRRYNVGYVVNPSDIAFLRGPDGKVFADIDLVIYVLDPNGAVVNSMAQSLHISGSVEEIKKAVANGVQYKLPISTPAKGEYFLRIAVHDRTRDHFGAVELPISEVRNLTPGPTPPAPPAK
jgi:VWFA-related protein